MKEDKNLDFEAWSKLVKDSFIKNHDDCDFSRTKQQPWLLKDMYDSAYSPREAAKALYEEFFN